MFSKMLKVRRVNDNNIDMICSLFFLHLSLDDNVNCCLHFGVKLRKYIFVVQLLLHPVVDISGGGPSSVACTAI